MTELFSVSCFLIFTLSLRAFVALLVPSSHPPTVFVWRSVSPRWAGVQGCQAEKPQGRAVFEPLLCPWFDAVHLSVVGCLCQALQEVHYFRPFQQQSLSLPPYLQSRHPLSAATLSSWAEQQGHWIFPSIFRCDHRQLSYICIFNHIRADTMTDRKMSGHWVIHSTGVVKILSKGNESHK